MKILTFTLLFFVMLAFVCFFVAFAFKRAIVALIYQLVRRSLIVAICLSFTGAAMAYTSKVPCAKDVKHAKDIPACLRGDVYLNKAGKASWNEEAINKMKAIEQPKQAKARDSQARQIFYFFVVAIPVSALLFGMFFIFKVTLASFLYRAISGSYADARRRKRAARQLEAKRRKAQQTMA